jgi:uncharacterized membrane protein YdjX (TVP38/TMEM64 family)
MKYQRLQRTVFIVFAALLIASLAAYYLIGDDVGLSDIRESLKDFGIWAPLAFIAVYVVGTIFIPSTPFMALAGVMFGFKYGLAYTVIGGFLSSVLVFLVARNLGQEGVQAILKNRHLKFLAKYNKRLGRSGLWDLIILRLTPIMPFNILNLLMGVSKIKTSHYIVGTLLGLLPSIALTVYFGNVIAKLF